MNTLLSGLLVATTFAAPALHAEDCLERAWSGTLGKSKVTLEFRTISGFEQPATLKGRYYYNANWNELLLERQDDGDWLEKDAKDAATGRLKLDCSSNALTGQWHAPDGSRSLDLRAQPAEAFHAQQRKDARAQLLESARFQGRAYDVVSAHRDSKLKTFRLKGDQAGLAGVNELLWQRHLDTVETAADCASDGRFQRSEDNDYGYSLRSEICEWNDSYLVVTSHEEGYCGGAHPFWGFGGQTFNLATGKKENMEKWLARDYADAIAAESALDQHLRKIYASGMPADDHLRECREAIAFSTTALWPRHNGLAFAPQAPHALSGCVGEEVILPYAQSDTFLSDYGKAQIKHFRQH
jgi:hypothetical protein